MSENLPFLLFLCFPFMIGVLLVYCLRSYGDERSWSSLIIGNFLVFVFLLAIVFVIAESYYRFIYDTTDSLGYTKVSRRWYQRHNILNAAGFRDNVEYFPKIVPGKRRITFLGDSFTMGHGVNNVDKRFANLIRVAHPEWEINVIAIEGLETQGEIELLETGFRNGYQIDLVVLVYCLNDVADILPEWDNAYQTIMADAYNGNWLRQNSYYIDIMYHHYKAADSSLKCNFCK